MSKHKTFGDIRLKMTKEKALDELCRLKLFGKDLDFAIFSLAKKNGYMYTTIKPIVDQLFQEKRIMIDENGLLQNNAKTYIGKVMSKSGENYAHIQVEGNENDIYVNNKNEALNGDIVEVAVRDLFGKQEGVILNIKERGTDYLFGTVRKVKNEYIFQPSDKNFDCEVVLLGSNLNESVDKKVKVKLTYADVNFVRGNKNILAGNIEKIYGVAGDPIVENVVIAEEYGFTKDFPEDVMKETERISDTLTHEDSKDLVDLTYIPFYTIDPENCKDIDDAVYVEKNGDSFIAYVALADVEYYVKEGSLIDAEAYQRGTSCYLGDGVYPMLPEVLSNGICSLNQGEDRRTLCAKIIVNKEGEITHYEFMRAKVNCTQLSYEQAEKIHTGELSGEGYNNLKKSIDVAYELSDALVKMRNARGALVLKNDEPTYILNSSKTGVEGIVDKTQISSTKIIESLMILYNEAMGDLVVNNNLKTLFRVHDKPKKDKLTALQHMCNELGFDYDGNSSSASIRKLLKSAIGDSKEEFLNSLVLRSMQRAKYQPKNIGHYALASERYIHSTAAIRRYPDIITQRVLVNCLDGKKEDSSIDELELIGKHLSKREVDADKASIESDKLMAAIWAQKHINEVFQGKICGVLNSGVFVKINNMAQIFVPLEDLVKKNPKNYKANSLRTEIFSSKSFERYMIGDSVEVKIVNADRNTRTITGERIKVKENDIYEDSSLLEENINFEKDKENNTVKTRAKRKMPSLKDLEK